MLDLGFSLQSSRPVAQVAPPSNSHVMSPPLLHDPDSYMRCVLAAAAQPPLCVVKPSSIVFILMSKSAIRFEGMNSRRPFGDLRHHGAIGVTIATTIMILITKNKSSRSELGQPHQDDEQYWPPNYRSGAEAGGHEGS